MSENETYWQAIGIAEEGPDIEVVEQKVELRQLKGGPGAHSVKVPLDKYRRRQWDKVGKSQE